MKSKKRAIDFTGKWNFAPILVGSWSAKSQHRSIAMSVRQPRGMGDERHTMNFRETLLLRTKLRQVNMEHSALVLPPIAKGVSCVWMN